MWLASARMWLVLEVCLLRVLLSYARGMVASARHEAMAIQCMVYIVLGCG